MNNACNYGLCYTKKSKKKDFLNKYCIVILIDGFTISSSGNLLLEDVEIPLFTYFWLLKSSDKLKVKIINNRIIDNCRISKYDNNMQIDCDNREPLIYKQYEVNLTNHINCALSVSNLNFIKYKNKIMLEMNEKIIQYLKPVMQNTDNLDFLCDYIDDKKMQNDKIIVIIDNRLNIKIVNKIKNTKCKNINDVLKSFKSQKEVGIFIKSF
jgi:hypothetical protein